MGENKIEPKNVTAHSTSEDGSGDESKNIAFRTMSIESYSASPLPPAEELEHYERIRPGVMVEKFIKWVEDEAKHRRVQEDKELETANKELDAAIKSNRRGQYLAFAITVLALVVVVVCAVFKLSVAAVVAPTIIGCTSLAAVFLDKKK
jgi:uncharacterized membrane protein